MIYQQKPLATAACRGRSLGRPSRPPHKSANNCERFQSAPPQNMLALVKHAKQWLRMVRITASGRADPFASLQHTPLPASRRCHCFVYSLLTCPQKSQILHVSNWNAEMNRETPTGGRIGELLNATRSQNVRDEVLQDLRFTTQQSDN